MLQLSLLPGRLPALFSPGRVPQSQARKLNLLRDINRIANSLSGRWNKVPLSVVISSECKDDGALDSGTICSISIWPGIPMCSVPAPNAITNSNAKHTALGWDGKKLEILLRFSSSRWEVVGYKYLKTTNMIQRLIGVPATAEASGSKIHRWEKASLLGIRTHGKSQDTCPLQRHTAPSFLWGGQGGRRQSVVGRRPQGKQPCLLPGMYIISLSHE